jgi:hypothetical protein
MGQKPTPLAVVFRWGLGVANGLELSVLGIKLNQLEKNLSKWRGTKD